MATGAPPRAARGTVPATVAAASLVLAISVFLPWYTADVAPPFAPQASSGWDASMFARVALALENPGTPCDTPQFKEPRFTTFSLV